MVRETRYLWIGNLPHTIREDRILEHFKRYGKVQSVKILPKKEEENGACATVAFIDIKSASKAHNADNKIDDRTLKTDYYEPPASSTASSAIYIHERDDALVRPAPAPYTAGRTPRYGLSEERNYERPGHYYADREPYMRRPLGIGYHDEDNYPGRAKSRDRYSRSAPGNNYTEGAERNQNHFRPHNARQHFDQQRYPVGDQYNDEREPAANSSRLNRRTNNTTVTPAVASVASPTTIRTENRPRRTKRRSPSRTPSGSRSNSGSRSRSRSSSGSRSSSSSSKLRSSSSDSSGRSRSPSKSRSPVSALYGSQNNTKGSRLDRPSSAIANPSSTVCYLPSAVNASAINCTSSNTQGSTPSQGCTLALVENHCDREEKRPLGICVRNLPVRSTDTSLKDGLFHEYKKHGKVTMVKVIGQGTDRYAVVCFKKPEDVDKALEVSKDKLFFGCKIEVTAHEGLDAEDNEFRPLEAELDEFHPKATRTLFIGNLEKDITTPELRKHFDQFGEIIEIDIKKQGSATSYAFIQYSDIASVVKAMRKLDGENLGANRIKLGFGKSMPTNCVWLDGIVDSVSDKFLARHFSRFGIVAYTAVDREKGHALVFYENVEFAQIAVSEMRGRILQGKKLQVDFASRECQTTFFDKLEMTGQMVPGDGTRPWERRERRGPEFEVVRSDDREPRVGFENRVYPRYEAQPRPPRGNFRGGQRAGFSSRGRGQGFSARYEVYHDEFGERRHRYNSRDESVPEVTLFDGKVERPKYVETPECPNRKRNKLRNSISDQESHHSQSPPRSCHQSRSTSPVSKDRKSLKERLHHRVKSPGSHNSSLVNSPCRDVVSDEMETNSDYRDSRSKGDEIMTDLSYTSPINTSPRSTEKDTSEKALLKGETDSLRSRSSLDADSADESCSTNDQLGRKKRFLACSLLKSGKDQNPSASKSLGERAKGKVPNSHVNSLKPVKLNCVSDETVEENKCDTDNSVQQECTKAKPHQTESANTDLKYLQKKQVQLLHLLEQLGENANSSDTEGLIDGERVVLKKHRSPSACSETNSLFENDSLKSLTKDESGIKLCKSGVKDPAIFTKLKSKTDCVDSNNCISLSLDSFIFQKHLDPRKGCDQHSVSIASVNSLQKCRRISVDNETCLPILQGANDSFLCAPSPITDVSWRKECNSLSDVHFPETDGSLSISHLKVKEETISDDDTLISKKSFPLDLPNRILSLRTLSDMRHEVKRERDISPLSLPLPKFAASLRSPKSSPSVLTSPKSTTAHSPRAGLSPSSYASGKNIRITDLLQDFQNEKKTKDPVSDEKMNGASVSPVDSISPFETQAIHEAAEPISSMESIQSPKSNCEKVKESHSSSESEISPSSSPNRPSIEDRIKALDEKFNAWSGSTRTTVATPDAVPVSVPEVPKCPVKRSRFNFLAPEIRSEPSEIVKSLLASCTIFDQDSKRLQHIDEKYDPVNVKMDSPPKVKPTFRTKAAAKEFSMPIAPATQTFNQSSLVKNPSTILVAQSIMSPPTTPQSATGSVLSPITPPIQQFNSQLTPQVFTPCSPCATTPFGLAPSIIKNSEGLNSVDKDFSEHVLKSTTVFNSVKIKAETNFHVNSSALATSLKSPLHCPVEVIPHTMVVSSPPSIKKEPSSPTDNATETVCKFEIDCKVPMKKEVPVHNITSIPLRNDGCISLTKDHLHFNSFDNDKKEFCDSKDPRLSFHEGSSHWRENGCKDDVNVDSCAKSFTGNPDVPINNLGPATKKRVSSIDSTESESSKSVKSLDSSRDSHEMNWSKHEKTSEPEPKKPKLCKSVMQDRSSSPPSQPHPKKNEKKEKSMKPEKSKTSTSKSSSSSSTEKSKSSKMEYKDKSKSEHKNKEEKRSKSRDSKESTSSKDQRTKSRERRNSEKDNKGGCSNNPSSKSKKDPHVTKNESKHEMKGDNKFENKGDDKGDSKHENKGEGRHENKGEGKHENKGDGKHENKGEGRHDNKGEGRHENKGEGRHENKGEGRHENKGDGRHENKGEGRHENKGEGRHENKGEGRHENKGDGRHENKGEGRHENKGDGRHENKGEGRHENKGEGRHENKGESRHENKGEGRHENKGEGRHENKGEGRHENKGEGRHENKGEGRHENKGEGRHENKEGRHENKEGRHENKGEGKHDNRGDSKKERHESRHENKYEMKYENRHKSRSESKHDGKYEIKSESKNDSDYESKSEDAKGEKKQSDKKSSSKKSSSSSLPFDFQAFMDDEPVYFSMYDKVKARSSKSQTLKHQTSDLESVRQKFSKLKQSRAKREEKTKSIDQDSDKDSDSGSHRSSESDSQAKSTKVKQPRKRKLVIESSSDDGAVSHDSSSRISKMEKDFNDSATDSDFEYNVSRRQSSSLKVRKKKTDVLNSDSSDSDSNFATKSQTSCSKKKSMQSQSRSKPRPEKTKKIIRSDYEMSDAEVQQKCKEKDLKPKKLKKEKTTEIKQEGGESMDCEIQKKPVTDDSKTYKKKIFKEGKLESEVSSQKKVKSDHISKEKQISTKEKKIDSGPEKMQVDDIEKHKPFSKKRKKSKKMSKNKEKRSSTEKISQDPSRKQEDSDARSSLPVLSPKPSNPLPEKQLSPPYLQAGVFSDNDFKSDFSDFDFETHQNDNVDLNSDIWKQLDAKSDSNSDKSSKSKKKDIGLKSQNTVIQSPEQDSSLPSFFDKLSDITDSETGREPNDCTNDVLSDGQKHHDLPLKKEKESNVSLSPHKSKHDKHEDQSIKQESSKYSEAHLTSSKEERRKKKSKKQSKEKKKKTREEKETPPVKDSASSSILASSPKALFEPLAADDDSRLSDLQLDEVIADETRHFEPEFVVVTPETSTFDDDGPTKREEKLVERRFEEEAAKETRRLEAELFSTGRDSWHMKEKDYDPEAETGELCEEKQPCEIDSLTGKEENIFTGLDLHSSIIEPSQNEGDVFLSGPSESDPFQLDDKDVNEIEDQRKIEDDLAVSALLQEMQCSEISAPELTKEPDYLEPLIETHPEDTMNYLLPDDGENSLHIADSSPEVQGNESQDEKLEPSVMLLSPSSNSEPPALEISTVEDSALKIESGGQTCLSEPLKEKSVNDSEILPERKSVSCYDFHEDSLEMCESKPPVIDIPVISDNLEPNRSSASPKADRVKIHKAKEREKPITAALKTDSNEDTDNESGSELAENQLTHFEDITMDTTDSKDDDNPPILMPVESPRNLLPVADPKEKIEPVTAVPIEENQSTNTVTSKSTEQVGIAESVFDRLSSDIEKQFGEIINRISEQPKTETKPLRIPDSHERCSMSLNISDLSDQNSSDSLFINNAGIFSNSDETSSVIKPFIKSQEASNLNISNDLDEESNHCKYSLSESLSSAIDPPMLNYTDMLNTSCETPVIQSPPKADNDNDTMSLPDKSIQNLESFTTEVGDASTVSDTNQASSDSFLLDLFGPKSVENEKVEIDSHYEKLKTDDDLVSNSDSKNKTEDSNISSLDNNQSSQAATSFAISEVNEQNEATEFNQEIFERSPDLDKDSKLPQLLSFSSEQLFTELTNKSTANVDDTSLNDTNIELNYQDISPKVDDSLKSESDKTMNDESKNLDSSEKLDVPEPKVDEKSMDISTEEHLSLEDSLDIKTRPADAESVCSDTTDITIPETKGEAEINQVACSEEPMPEELHPVEDVDLAAKPKLERPRRGRRPKTRKYVETVTQKQDIIPEPIVTTVTSTRSSSRRIRPTSSERPRRSLRSDNADTIVLREYGKKRHSVDESVHSETEDLKKDISGEISDGLVSDTATAEADSIPNASTDSLEQKSAEKFQTKNEEPRRRRGRRKKASNDIQPLSIDRLETKSEESDFSKEFHRPKESISWLSLLSSEKEQKSSKDNNPSSAYDIFEFREEEDENPRFGSMKERLHDTTRSTASTSESKHTKVLDQKHDKVTDLKHDRLNESKHERVIDQKHDRLSDQKVKERLHDTTRSASTVAESKHAKALDQKLEKVVDLKHDRLLDQKHDRLSDQKAKERLHDTTRSNTSASDSKHIKALDQKHDKTIDLKHDRLNEPKHERVIDQKHDRLSDQKNDKVAENIHEKEKKPDEAIKTMASEDRDVLTKEPHAEAKEHKKISIIIRLHSKDGHDGSSPGTAEIIHPSEALNTEEAKQEQTKIEKISLKSDAPGSEVPYNGPCKSTRKSTRLMNQALKSTVDEVIEDVVKGNFKESNDPLPAESTPTRVTRRSRSNRRSEENFSRDIPFETFDDTTDDKNKNEPVFFIHDNAVKDIPEDKKKLSSQPNSEVAPAADVSTPDSDKIPLRLASLRTYRMSHRITRSTASKLESNRDTPSSTLPSNDQELKKKDTISSNSSDEKSDILKQEVQKEPKEAPKEIKPASESSVVCHPPLPVLKVEINRVSSLELNRVEAKRVRVVEESPKEEPPQPEKLPENEDSNSTSSTAVLIDPVTGILTSVDKSEYYSEANNPSVENKNNNPVSDLSGISTSVLNIKSISKPNLTPDTVAATSVIQDSSKSTYANKSENIPAPIHPPLVQNLRSRQNSNPTPTAVTGASDVTPTSNIETVSKLPCTTEKSVEHIKLPTKKTAVAASVLAIDNSLAASSSATTVDHTESAIPSSVVTAQASRGQSPVITGRAVPTINSPAPVTVLTHDKNDNVQSKVPTLPAHSYESPVRTTAVVTSVSMGLITSISSDVPNKCSTSSAVTCITSSKSELPVAITSANIPPMPVSEHVSSVSSCKPLSLTASGPPEHSISVKQEVHATSSSSLPSTSIHSVPTTSTWSSSKITSDRITDSHAHVSTIQSSTTSSSAYAKSDGRTSKSAHSGKNNSAFTQQTGFAMSNYEEMLSGAHGLAAASGGGVIAELLQNPQLLQQHKEFFTAGQLQDRNLVQMVRPATPVAPNIPPEIAARLGNPTPPHTPTPPVTSSNHSLPPADIHSHSGLHIRHPSQPGLIVPPHPSLGLHPSDVNAFVHQQMIYAAAHNPYAAAALHGDLRVQQEAQVRAAAMGMNSRFGYHSMPPSSIVSNNFKQPSEPRHPPSVMDAKSEQKLINDLSKILNETRGSEEKSQRSKSMRSKKEFAAAQKEKELKMMHSDSRDDPESGRLIPSHEKIPSTSAIAPHSLRQPQHAHYSSQILQMSPRLTVSPHERITDSPVVANLYTTGPGRVPQITLAGQVDDHKSESNMGAHSSHHYKNDMSETIKQPPVAHQSQPSTNPYHALEASVHPRQQLLGVPQIGSAATGHLDGRSGSAHSPGSHPYKKDLTHSQQMSSLHNSASDKRVSSDHSKKVFNARTMGHQGSSISPGPVGLPPAHSPVQWPVVIQSHSSHPSLAQSPHLMLAGCEQSNRRVNSHLPSQMRSEAPMHGPPPAHAMSQSTNVPRALSQTPPHSSQAPLHADQFLLQRYPVMWQGLLALKNDQAAVQMHFVSGNPNIARASLPPIVDGEASPVRIAQRMRLEHLQLEGVKKKIQMLDEHCVLMALPCGKDHFDVLQQSSNLKNGFINYLQQKQAAGIVNAAPPGSQQPAYVIHIFPSCDFTDNNLTKIAPDLLQIICDLTHLVIVIATV